MIREWNSGDGELPDRLILSLSDRLGGVPAPSLRCAEPSLGSAPSGHSLVVLAALVPRAPVGYPLLSLTRNAKAYNTNDHGRDHGPAGHPA
jgi:hypothetical protein